MSYQIESCLNTSLPDLRGRVERKDSAAGGMTQSAPPSSLQTTKNPSVKWSKLAPVPHLLDELARV